MELPLVSVVIPVYNTHAFLNQCISSVLSQTYSNLQIIIIDDGSCDECAAICDEFACKERVSVIHKANGGPADARNFGIDNLSGEWVLFLDSDDYYENEFTINNLIEFANRNGSDLVCFNYKRFFQSNNTFSEKNLCINNSDNNLYSMVNHGAYTSSPCTKLIKTELILNNKIYFQTGVLSEDIEFCAKLFLHANNTMFFDDAVYIYRMRVGSITNTISIKHVHDLLQIIDGLVVHMDSYRGSKLYLPLASYTAFQYCTVLINAHIAHVDKQMFSRVYGYRYLLKFNSNQKVKLVDIACKLVGIKLAAWLLYFYFKIVNNK